MNSSDKYSSCSEEVPSAVHWVRNVRRRELAREYTLLGVLPTLKLSRVDPWCLGMRATAVLFGSIVNAQPSNLPCPPTGEQEVSQANEISLCGRLGNSITAEGTHSLPLRPSRICREERWKTQSTGLRTETQSLARYQTVFVNSNEHK